MDAVSDAFLRDEKIFALRENIFVETDVAIPTHSAEVNILLANGEEHHHHVRDCVGSLRNPMTDAQLCAKFRQLCLSHMARSSVERLLSTIKSLPELADAGSLLASGDQHAPVLK
jgi:2-methylcitrate dehydratase PrpD